MCHPSRSRGLEAYTTETILDDWKGPVIEGQGADSTKLHNSVTHVRSSRGMPTPAPIPTGLF